jgi:hypothetical protein
MRSEQKYIQNRKSSEWKAEKKTSLKSNICVDRYHDRFEK